MIQVRGLTKEYGTTSVRGTSTVRAVDDLTFDVQPGKVTGFLGPNGAGKSTTMRMVLGLDRPTAGSALVAGRPFATLAEPLRTAGALLDAGAVHPGRSGRDHLRVAARTHGIPLRRVDDVVDQVGLGPAARRRVRGYSLGMRQRLGIATALLGDPAVLLFDEPMNGLDLDGVRWIRRLVRGLADEGRTVLLSSHLMSEMEQTADHLVIIGRGRLIADASMQEVMRGQGAQRSVRVRTPSPDALVGALRRRRLQVHPTEDGDLLVEGTTAETVGDVALETGVAVHRLAEEHSSLEQVYLDLTGDSVQYRVAVAPEPAGLVQR
ncbi:MULTISPECIES: ABC transporter ATP-binding protein [unclassified Modestobacter]|uniref:ABC transporter ATP-binding protein n=1 Tax=unclassified Modestobacter TaxID=2643866 RepID=UPI0022AB26B6|nr:MULTISPECIES: ATP-binding cassette domain-containing protein [unclassified Modestobacter]MCZ2811707.1 ATP-binding cassette domain-containing protein [Modestobacter sp. VKM Ac-2979]MCZ2843430.1 ATP-binding cassette domain-containing protein [Modestobacter sp. VKM Ac-2980]MCZ2848611.1 ATP-binding cassette domain-containing protein [Modestobacter sp. VKM Ac-2978]